MTPLLSIYHTAVAALPNWLALAIGLLVAAAVMLLIVRVFGRMIFRLIGVVVSLGIGVAAHLLLHPVLASLLQRYTSWRG